MISIYITHSTGETTAYQFALTEGVQFRIGRDPSCEISLPEETYLSRVHCFISYTNGQFVIQDNQSSNGVFLGDQRIVSDFLVMNQPYRMGNCTMVVQEDESAEGEEGAVYPQAATPSTLSQPYSQPESYPAATQPYPAPTQAYPLPAQAYPQPAAYPQPESYPQPAAYPQPESYPQPAAYPQPESYPQPAAYPQPESYPQPAAYPQPESYPQPEASPQPESYPQSAAYPQPESYPQPEASPQPESYPQPEASPQPEADIPEGKSPAQEEPPIVDESIAPETIEETIPKANIEEMLASELAAKNKTTLRDKWSGVLSAGKSKLGKWTAGLRKNKLPRNNPRESDLDGVLSDVPAQEELSQPSEPAEVPVSPAPQPAAPQDVTPVAEVTPRPDETPTAEKAPNPPVESREVATPPVTNSSVHQESKPDVTQSEQASPNAKHKVVVHKRKNKKTSEPELQVIGLPGTLLDLPTGFDVLLRVTTPAPRFEEGAPLRFCVKTKQDCRVFLVAHDSSGGVEVILPGEDGTDNLAFAAVEAKFPSVGHEEYHMLVEPPLGAETIVLVAYGATTKCDFLKELRAKIAQSAPNQLPGELEKQAIADFCSKHPKQKDIAWSSAVLNITTSPKPELSAPGISG